MRCAHAGHIGTIRRLPKANRKGAEMTDRIETSLGELISTFYEEFLAVYGDEETASLATAAAINDLLANSTTEQPVEAIAA